MNTIITYVSNAYFRIAYFRHITWTIIAFTLFIILFLFIKQATVVTRPIGWEKSFLVSYNIAAKNPKIASRGNFIIAVYESDGKGKKGIYASISFNGGGSFLKPVKIAEIDSELDANPYAAISSSGHITIMWGSFVEKESTSRIFYTTSTNMGADWSKAEQVYIGSEMEMLPKIYYDNTGTLHLFYHGLKNGIFNLFHAVRTEETFKTTRSIIELSKDMKGAFFPYITFVNNEIYIVWQGKGANFTDKLYLIKSTNYGKSWSSKQRISNGSANDASPAMLLFDGAVYVVYQNNDSKSWAIKMIISNDGGDSWSAPIEISKTDVNCYAPVIGVSDRDLIVMWYDARERMNQVFFNKYNIRERKTEKDQKLTFRNYPARDAALVQVAKNKLLLFWQEGNSIMAKYSDVYAAPPYVYSYTHPSGQWSRQPVAEIRWKKPGDESGIVGYAVIVNELPGFNPSIQNIKADINQQVVTGLKDGISYFHIRAIDGAGNFSRTEHYKLLVSTNPLPMPVVISPTHPEGKASQDPKPEFRWVVDYAERLKGFYFSVSKNQFQRPDTFISSFELKLPNLPKGSYFFRIRGIDKTNQLGNIAVYNFIVGEGKALSPDDWKKYYNKDLDKGDKIIPKKPSIEIDFSFGNIAVYDKSQFKGVIVAKNIAESNIIGYSLHVSKEKDDPLEKVNHKSRIFHINELTNGDYYMSAKCNYYAWQGGRKVEKWTDPVIKKITIMLPVQDSPLTRYAKNFIARISDRGAVLSMAIISMLMSILVFGFGGKIIFYLKLFNFKMRVYLNI